MFPSQGKGQRAKAEGKGQRPKAKSEGKGQKGKCQVPRFRLIEPAAIERQVRHMLADDRAQAFVSR